MSRLSTLDRLDCFAEKVNCAVLRQLRKIALYYLTRAIDLLSILRDRLTP